MAFVENAAVIARQAMTLINPALADKYAGVIEFLSAEPETASAMRGSSAPEIGSKEYILKQAQNFAAGRVPKAPEPPSTVPDEMVSFILFHYFDIPEDHLTRAEHQHRLAMGAENMVGDLLERYLASVLEPMGWIWCSGSMVKAVDFIKPPSGNVGWRLLQVKNRNNSENSSSSAIRAGTKIEKWFRTFSRKPGSNWAAFPDITLKQHLSEEDFRTYVAQYLHALREDKKRSKSGN